MDKQEFDKLSGDKMVQPIYPEYVNKEFNILTINHREGLIELDEKRMWSDSTWYRYENINLVDNKTAQND